MQLVKVAEGVLEVALAHVAMRSLRARDEIGFHTKRVWARRRPRHAVCEEIVHRQAMEGEMGMLMPVCRFCPVPVSRFVVKFAGGLMPLGCECDVGVNFSRVGLCTVLKRVQVWAGRECEY